MSGRGGRGRGGRFGRGGGPPGPQAKDDDGTVIGTEIAGPPPLFPQTLLPAFPDITPRQEALLSRRTVLSQVTKRTPFFLEARKDTLKATDVDARVAQWAQSTTSGSNAGGVGLGIRKARQRAPLVSAMRLLPEYFPEELFGASAKRASRMQEAYWKHVGKKQDPTGFLTELYLQKESKQGEGEGRQPGQEEGEEPEEDLNHDTDDEEDMDDDDYYKGADFDDDEGYDDDMGDGGGDEGALY
uniref:DNA-directed RNA polymerase III subunit n=1 Tax=Dunaliella tertiolecta TaxID=3047 RepID=A0A7S3VVU2_DUNTE|mmetsp:Transcript_18412/g.51611  ORF Transcript_18412/g.51611 Transcript_18412/m.51611 type:complete len:242 (+) Transcript_18412:185-910(+)|eukprot:CAMPEP_0202348662 /NCGR_PEP_ID=MMETSP1126-20121109/6483_1 /ASSEMBLY_ACC=CAM_ASM_000457 /TAXON_ID=3047 /ORGANISM="Dunaliella tertiolecta, Strain CCMP1320" /LENGTH=241 /DNA_ID=CAMNT_0048940355 /DNA_START=96 /DNA_END=821 /DNA_ORIENTATION=-